MKTYALISQKGGAGKSTLARALSVLAGEDGPSFLIDRDPQQTTANWWRRRQDVDEPPQWPDLIDIGTSTLTKAIATLKPQPGTLFVDTRPQVSEPEAEAARLADRIVVPVRPSPDDIEALNGTLAMLRRLNRRPLVVVNAAKNDRRAIEARAALSEHGIAVCPQHITDRTAFLDASSEGRGLSEMRGASAAAADAELRKVWGWIQETGND